MKTEELFAVCDPEELKKAILNEDDDKLRSELKGMYAAREMYTNDIRYFLGKQDIEGLKQSLVSKDIEMTALFSELIFSSDPLVEARLRSQIKHGIFIRKKLLKLL